MIANFPAPPGSEIGIGPLQLRAYGLMIALGVLAAVWLFGRRLEEKRAGTRDDATAIAAGGHERPWHWCVSISSLIVIPTSSPAENNSGLLSHVQLSRSRRSCCWTSLFRALTPTYARNSDRRSPIFSVR